MITLWGRNNSINVQKVVWCLEELGRPYERIDAGLAHGINRTPEYLAMNPNGLIPVLRDGEAVLWESNSIVRYLSAAYSMGGLWPMDPKVRAQADRWCDWQLADLNPSLTPLFWGIVRKPGSVSAEALATARTKFENSLAILDRHLQNRDFLSGATLTFADIVIGPALHRWLNMPVDREPHANVERYYRGLAGRHETARAFILPIS